MCFTRINARTVGWAEYQKPVSAVYGVPRFITWFTKAGHGTLLSSSSSSQNRLFCVVIFHLVIIVASFPFGKNSVIVCCAPCSANILRDFITIDQNYSVVWAITRRKAVWNRRFGTALRSYLQGSDCPGRRSLRRVTTQKTEELINVNRGGSVRSRVDGSVDVVSLPYDGYRVCIPGVKRSGRGVNHPPFI